ncbi:hypothetical protein BC332_29167 [Capsicum chinense]|nr:hypothetical protein BC332_29167 [Capsicum chinense]
MVEIVLAVCSAVGAAVKLLNIFLKNKQASNQHVRQQLRNHAKTSNQQPPITTAVLKSHCRCQGCNQKIDEIVTIFKGLAETLKKHLKKEIEIVLPKKEGGEKKEKGGGGGGKVKGKGREGC